MTEDNRDKAGEIEKDIVQTQNSISDTVDKLKERLTPQSLLDSVLGGDKHGFDQIVSLAKRNPFAVALIGAGAAWLATGKEASLPSSLTSNTPKPGSDSHHRSYVDHMAQVEMRPNESPALYQQRRDLARSNYFMIERSHDEDEPSFRKRLDDAGDKLRDKTAALGGQIKEQGEDLKASLSDNAGKAKDQAQAAMEKTKQLYRDNAVIGGLLAAVTGAIAGSALPTTRVEQDKLGDIADSTKSALTEQKDKLVDKAEKSLGGESNDGPASKA